MVAKVVHDALKHVWVALEPLNIPMAVMGGLALAHWGHVRATQDVDLLLGIKEGDVPRILPHLSSAEIRTRFEPPTRSLGQLQILQLLYEPPGSFLELQIDLLLGDSAYHQETLSRRLAASLPSIDVKIAILTCEDLILHKLLAGRIIDRVDAGALLRLNRGTLDFGYFKRWARFLGVQDQLLQIWQEALPDETPPSMR
jgi:hypothetical protein